MFKDVDERASGEAAKVPGVLAGDTPMQLDDASVMSIPGAEVDFVPVEEITINGVKQSEVEDADFSGAEEIDYSEVKLPEGSENVPLEVEARKGDEQDGLQIEL